VRGLAEVPTPVAGFPQDGALAPGSSASRRAERGSGRTSALPQLLAPLRLLGALVAGYGGPGGAAALSPSEVPRNDYPWLPSDGRATSPMSPPTGRKPRELALRDRLHALGWCTAASVHDAHARAARRELCVADEPGQRLRAAPPRGATPGARALRGPAAVRHGDQFYGMASWPPPPPSAPVLDASQCGGMPRSLFTFVFPCRLPGCRSAALPG
jgi:hypothetical protein